MPMIDNWTPYTTEQKRLLSDRQEKLYFVAHRDAETPAEMLACHKLWEKQRYGKKDMVPAGVKYLETVYRRLPSAFRSLEERGVFRRTFYIDPSYAFSGDAFYDGDEDKEGKVYDYGICEPWKLEIKTIERGDINGNQFNALRRALGEKTVKVSEENQSENVDQIVDNLDDFDLEEEALEKAKPEHLPMVVNVLNKNIFLSSQGDTGRVAHSFSQLPSYLRQHITYQGEAVEQVDICGSNFAFLQKLWNEKKDALQTEMKRREEQRTRSTDRQRRLPSIRQTENLMDKASEGTLYEAVASCVGISRDKAKKALLIILAEDTEELRNEYDGYIGRVYTWIRKCHPALDSLIRREKYADHARLVKMLMAMEADVINEACATIGCIPVCDCVIVPESKTDEARFEIYYQAKNQYGIELTTEIE